MFKSMVIIYDNHDGYDITWTGRNNVFEMFFRLIDEEAMGILKAGKALGWTSYGTLDDVRVLKCMLMIGAFELLYIGIDVLNADLHLLGYLSSSPL